MDTRLKKLAVTFAIMTVLLSCTSANMKIAFSDNTGANIDLFTQKEPYSGKGTNMPSDAFAPEEEVNLTAYLTYNDEPVPGKLVGTEVIDPDNKTLLYRSPTTNENGMATMGFRLASNATFGTYLAIATAEVSGKTVNDTLTFKVGWIVEIVSIKTINENYVEQEKFMRWSHVGIELVLRSIAMTEKKITLAVAIYDCLNTPLNSTEEAFELHLGNTTAYFFLYIPKSACVSLEREAIARACIYTAPCPEVSKPFFITNRDIAVLSVQPSPAVVYSGETVSIDVIVKNKGLEIESFDVSVYFNETLIGMLPVFDLQPFLDKTVSFVWNTSYVEEGLYRIGACVEPVPGEIDTLDNVLIYDFVEVRGALFLLMADLLFLLAVFSCVAVIVFVLLWERERKKKGQMCRQSTSSEVKPCKEVGFKRSKTCSVCGKEFLGVYTFCPYCFAFHGKDHT
jgi:hypothetical protein